MYFSRGFLLPGLMGILFLLLTGGLLAGLKGLIAAFLIAVLYAAGCGQNEGPCVHL